MKNMKRDPGVCLTADDQTPPYAFVQIDGIATFATTQIAVIS